MARQIVNIEKTALVYEGDEAQYLNSGRDFDGLSRDGFDFVGASSIGSNLQLRFAKRSRSLKWNWRYKIEQEGVFEQQAQERALNLGDLRGWELVAVAVIDGRYMRYFCRLPAPKSIGELNSNWVWNLTSWWESKVVERPVSTLPSLQRSLSSLKKEGWVYRDHAVVKRDDGHLFLVYLQRPSTDPRTKPS